MADLGEAGAKRMRLRYDRVCRICEAALPARTEAVYDRATPTVRCVDHGRVEAEVPGTVVDVGTPGASARREHDRRRQAREDRIRAKHPRLGGLILAATADPQSTTAWDTGAVGEERLGARLSSLASDSLRVLHDRRVPGSRANIDHLAVTPAGVWVIDAKKYKGRPELRIEGGMIRPRTERLMVGGRDRTSLVAGVLTQVRVVRGLLGADAPVRGVLCFVEADWPLLGGAFSIEDVDVVWPKRLYRELAAPGSLGTPAIEQIHRTLASGLRSA